jgi:hypothetical protein
MADDDRLLRYLHRIETKLDRLNERLDRFLSAPRRNRAAGAADAGDPTNYLVAQTEEEAEALRKNNPDADIVITGVPRAGR